MIDLAPNSKRGLELSGPIVLAGGYGGEYPDGVYSRVHALLTSPTTLRPRAPDPDNDRLDSFPGGFMSKFTAPNPGLARVLSANRNIWKRLKLPIIFSLSSSDVNHWPEIARRLSRVEAISGLELEMNEDSDMQAAVAALRGEVLLPIIARIPIQLDSEGMNAAIRSGADAITLGMGPKGASTTGGETWDGRLTGPVLKPLVLRAIRQLAKTDPAMPVIGAGGIESASDVREMLEAGAIAVQVDTALWRDPDAIFEISA